MDGWIQIGTDLDTQKFDNKIDKVEIEIEELESKYNTLGSDKSNLQKQMEKTGQEINKVKQNIKELQAETAAGPQSQFDYSWAQKANELDRQKAKLVELNEEYTKCSGKINDIILQEEKITNKIEEAKIKIQGIELKKTENSMGNIDSSSSSISNKTENIISKIGRWALGIFGVRTAYNAVQRATSILSQYNKQLAADISYIQYALAKVLEPIILGFVNIVYKLLAYVNYLAQAWFGVNLFASASAKSFASASNSISKASKDAKELNKSLSGFDEMNIVQENGSTSTGGRWRRCFYAISRLK